MVEIRLYWPIISPVIQWAPLSGQLNDRR